MLTQVKQCWSIEAYGATDMKTLQCNQQQWRHFSKTYAEVGRGGVDPTGNRSYPPWNHPPPAADTGTELSAVDTRTRAVRRRTGGLRRRWVVLWPAAAASDRMREHWTQHSLNRRFFLVNYRGQPLHLWSLLGRWRRKVNCEYACMLCTTSQSWWVSGGSYKCNVECWGDADVAQQYKTRHWKCGNKTFWQSLNG